MIKIGVVWAVLTLRLKSSLLGSPSATGASAEQPVDTKCRFSVALVRLACATMHAYMPAETAEIGETGRAPAAHRTLRSVSTLAPSLMPSLLTCRGLLSCHLQKCALHEALGFKEYELLTVRLAKQRKPASGLPAKLYDVLASTR